MNGMMLKGSRLMARKGIREPQFRNRSRYDTRARKDAA